MQKRQVLFSVFINLLKERRPFSTLGILFPISAIIITIFLTIFINVNKEPYEKYDVQKIEKLGIEKNAIVSKIEMANVIINGKEVKIISYEYDNGGEKVIDKFKTLESDNIPNLGVGKKIAIKYFENQSIIKNIEPFVFPILFIFLLPSVFLLIGIPFFLILVIPSLRNYNLYKNGIVKEAEVASMEVSNNVVSNNSITRYKTGAQKIIVHYFFTGKNGIKIFGQSSTTDYSFFNEVKSGDKIKVFVSEENENKSCLIPKLEALKNNWKI